ncbi:MAG: hypothetical protein HY784_07400 [Chloroflexi bacterium]|nr:hypothetical protein [Chloroflexota bacterium]
MPSPPASAPTTPATTLSGNRLKAARRRLRIRMLAEWLVILGVAYLYSGANLLNFDAGKLQQTGEHN